MENIDRALTFGELHAGVYERIAPGYFPETVVREHAARYRWAAKFVAGKSVLDAGCGTGYGCLLLRTLGARRVVGTDIAIPALQYGRRTFGIDLVCADALHLPFPSNGFEVVTSFEVLEHVSNQQEFLAELRRVLVPGGVLVFSTPNKEITAGSNPYHVRELTLSEIFDLLKSTSFECLCCTGQRWRPTWSMWHKIPGIRRLAHEIENLSHIYNAPSALARPAVHILAAKKTSVSTGEP